MLLSVEEGPRLHLPPSLPEHRLDLCSLPGFLLRVLTPCLAAEEHRKPRTVLPVTSNSSLGAVRAAWVSCWGRRTRCCGSAAVTGAVIPDFRVCPPVPVLVELSLLLIEHVSIQEFRLPTLPQFGSQCIPMATAITWQHPHISATFYIADRGQKMVTNMHPNLRVSD